MTPPQDIQFSTCERWRHSLHRMVRCVRSLGIQLGWRYWRIQNRALVNPWLVIEWAENCDREAEALDMKNEGLLANQHRAWAAELRASYDRFISSPNDQAQAPLARVNINNKQNHGT